jgi:hypothetical protein
MTDAERAISELLDHSVKHGKTFGVEARLGNEYASISQPLLAIRHYAFAMELTRDQSQIWDLLIKQGHLQKKLGNHSTAIGLFMRAHSLFKDRPESMFHLICTLDTVHGAKAAASMLDCLQHPDVVSLYPGADPEIQKWGTSNLILVYSYYGDKSYDVERHMLRLLGGAPSPPQYAWSNYAFYHRCLELQPTSETVDKMNCQEVNVEDLKLDCTPLRGVQNYALSFSKHIHVDHELWTVASVTGKPGYVCFIARCDETLALQRYSGLTYIEYHAPFSIVEIRIEGDDVMFAVEADGELTWMSCQRVVVDQMLSTFTCNGQPE